MARQKLGSDSGFGVRTHVYLAGDTLEVDEIDGYNGVRKRVLLDEVVLVTLDRRRNGTTLAVAGGFAALLGLSGAVVGADAGAKFGSTSVALLVGLIFASPFLLVLLVHLLLGTDYVTVFGKRSSAQLAFSLRKGKARRVFARLQEEVARVQDEARRRVQSAPQ
jgi:CRISPR/Cas system-associated protein Csm6